jgi:hypothetical protein
VSHAKHRNTRILSCSPLVSGSGCLSVPGTSPPPGGEEKQKRIEFLEKKVQTKDEVLAELMAEHIALKKVLGNSNR